ncbi:4-hydroxy-tetrahydrodipicolinate synthase [bioreactor metagenome]|uniref:4-hydroxy-tetrahydrodipicolinate synthase n=1 Tax=bioreactor metagenome TaxID=1076179 RepID=A0A645HG20_9ZZZZ
MTNAATKLQLDMLDIINTLFIETNPIPVKAALEIMGKINGELRLPLIPISDSNRELLIESIKNFNQYMGVSA